MLNSSLAEPHLNSHCEVETRQGQVNEDWNEKDRNPQDLPDAAKSSLRFA